MIQALSFLIKSGQITCWALTTYNVRFVPASMGVLLRTEMYNESAEYSTLPNSYTMPQRSDMDRDVLY